MRYGDNTGLGRLITMKEITNNNNDDDNDNNKESKVQKPTRIMKISEHTYRMFVGHAKQFYDVETYDIILENLIRDFDFHNQNKSWRDINES